MSALFSLQYEGKHGSTVASDDAVLDAMKQAAYLRMCNITPTIEFHDDGCVTVKGLMLDPITYEPERSETK